MPEYTVTWVIDVFDCDTPEEAAREAMRIQKKSFTDSIAHVYAVKNRETAEETLVDIDLIEGKEDV